MLLVSFKLNKKRIAIICGLLCVALLVSAGFFLTSGRGADVAVSLNSNGAVTKNFTASDNAQRLAFIQQFGWEVEEDPIEIRDIIIPKEFDDVYLDYNEIQKRQGLDLSRYAGKQVKRCTYHILNYPGTDDDIRINLLIAENKIIGGDVCSMAIDGFLHGFKYEG